MNDLLLGGRVLLFDFASTLLFLAFYAITANIQLAVGLGIALAVGQIAWRLWRREAVDALQWVSLVTVAASGTATLVTHDARFVMLKPTIIYVLIGLTMLRPGWMTRYMPERALTYVPDLVVRAGYVWAGLMFLSAALNLVLAMTCSIVLWGSVMTIWGMASKSLLFFGQFTVMKVIGRRRAIARLSAT